MDWLKASPKAVPVERNDAVIASEETCGAGHGHAGLRPLEPTLLAYADRKTVVRTG